jgi:hypothetical protein
MSDTIFNLDSLKIIVVKFGYNPFGSFRGEDLGKSLIFISIIFTNLIICIFWEGPFHLYGGGQTCILWSFPCIYVHIYMNLQLKVAEICTRPLNSFNVN